MTLTAGLIFNTLGIIGVAIILGTYFALQSHVIDVKQFRYSALNFIGSSLILVSLFHEFNFPSFVVEVAWVIISIFGMVRYMMRRQKASDAA